MEGPGGDSIGRGAVTLTREVPATDLVVGDVIAFRPPAVDGLDAGSSVTGSSETGSSETGSSVTRRIVSIYDGVALTRGDNRDQNDPWRLGVSTATYPRVVLSVPWIGYPFSVGAGEGGGLVLVGAIGTGLVLAATRPWRRRQERLAQSRRAVHLGIL